MPRRSVLTPAQKVALLALPSSKLDFERYYTFTSNEIFIINQKRGLHNRIGFALMLCLIRYPGITYDGCKPTKGLFSLSVLNQA